MATLTAPRFEPTELPDHVEVAIIGAGFSGIAMAVELRRAGRDDFVLLERGNDVGGTWRDNSYPGCACDVPSHLYSFSFAPKPDWSSTFSPQEEIWQYLRDTAGEQGIYPHVQFGCEVEEARWDDDARVWRIRTSAGELTATALASAAGPLSEPSIPDIPGLRDFEGAVFHSASWDHDHDLTGERVAVIGTGASAIQFVPEIQPKVARLHLFQRTPPWITPRMARPLTRFEHFLYRRLPIAQRAMRAGIYWGRELYAVPLLRVRLSKVIERFARRHMESQVPDPALREKLIPDYKPGCKRILISNDYLPSLGRENVEVVTGGVAEVRPNSVVGPDGIEREVDAIILGTGFHVTDLPIAERLRGRDGRSLAEYWDGSLQALRGTTVAGYPNLFFLLGPNTGLGHTSVVLMAEAQARYVRQALEHLDRNRAAAVEALPQAQAGWNEGVQARMKGTVWTEGGCASWYIDAKGRNTTLWPDHTFRFFKALRTFDPNEYATLPAVSPAKQVEVAA
jgi:cation diffusion facilitator CzcD-associated flavoprotein CzcO